MNSLFSVQFHVLELISYSVTGCATEAFSTTCAVYAERIVRVGGSLTVMVQCRALAAQDSVGLIPGNCQPFSLSSIFAS